jgi:hypothetical protein
LWAMAMPGINNVTAVESKKTLERVGTGAAS